MSARDHVRAVETNRHTWKRIRERERNIIWAAMHGDDLLFGQLITGDPNWAPGEHSTLEERQEIMADYLRRRDH